MSRRRGATRFRPVLNSAEIAVAASIDDVSDAQDCRFLLVKHPESWTFLKADDHRLEGRIESLRIDRRNPDGIPAGRYLRVPVDSMVDPWGRVAVDLEFETPDGTQHAELTIQTREERGPGAQTAAAPTQPDSVHMYGGAALAKTASTSVFFVEGSAGDVLDLSDDGEGSWSAGDTDGSHTLYLRHDATGARTAALAVHNAVVVKLRQD